MFLMLGFGKQITLQTIPVLTFICDWIWTLSRRLFLGKEESILTIDIHITIAHIDSCLKDIDTSPTQSKVCVIISGERTIGTHLRPWKILLSWHLTSKCRIYLKNIPRTKCPTHWKLKFFLLNFRKSVLCKSVNILWDHISLLI